MLVVKELRVYWVDRPPSTVQLVENADRVGRSIHTNKYVHEPVTQLANDYWKKPGSMPQRAAYCVVCATGPSIECPYVRYVLCVQNDARWRWRRQRRRQRKMWMGIITSLLVETETTRSGNCRNPVDVRPSRSIVHKQDHFGKAVLPLYETLNEFVLKASLQKHEHNQSWPQYRAWTLTMNADISNWDAV